MKQLAIVALAGLAVAACTTVETTPDVALAPSPAPVVVERQTVVPTTPPLSSTTTVIQREQGTRIIR